MKNSELAIHLSNNLIQITESLFDGKTFHIKKLVLSEEGLPIFSNQSEKILEDEAKLIEDLINKAKINAKNIRVVIPDNVTFFQIIDLPLLSEKELLSAVKYQAEQLIPLPIDEVAIDISSIEEDKKEKKTKILMVAAPLNLINFLTKLIEETGLIPEVIENEISSFSRFITELYPLKNSPPLVFFNFGYDASSLYFYDSQKNLVTEVNTFNIGYHLFDKELRINFNFDNKKTNQILKEIGIEDNNQIKTYQILSPVVNEISKNISLFVELIKDKYKLPSIDQVFFINQSFLIKNLENQIAKQTKYHCSPFIVPTQPSINNSSSFVYNLSQYKNP